MNIEYKFSEVQIFCRKQVGISWVFCEKMGFKVTLCHPKKNFIYGGATQLQTSSKSWTSWAYTEGGVRILKFSINGTFGKLMINYESNKTLKKVGTIFLKKRV